MIILDTNVISELMRPAPAKPVEAWANSVGVLHTTTVTIAEVGDGLARLPDGRRRIELSEVAGEVFADFAERTISFDRRAANEYGAIVASRERAGRPIGTADAQIAAICRSRGASVATRNTADFDGTGIDVINPWKHISE